ncbi:MAG: DUF3795 domain-containing protein [Candidatus Cloacimonetes bacterium]|nr:DUF3795 domain-containing protein [Candidatus Cloacimonadota bacterium]MCF7813777.1 DUF3795 domain-containing protein [Candidatus Cloacimonadota bacterium]MCF7868351.1 DUF3795 domain-containing protein [Candidatus Cloacimonadota bacterium]MCF7883825.1 DUF3795 domain-containing protein [Candidatus Cloacimonadota bacterium]
MDYQQLTAPCGLDCWNCLIYQAAENEKLKKMIADKLKIPEEKVSCRGCRAEKGQIGFLDMNSSCKVFRCITGKGIYSCVECDEMPCNNLHPFADLADKRPHNLKLFNLCQIKKLGITEWAEKKAKQNRERYFKGKLEL